MSSAEKRDDVVSEAFRILEESTPASDENVPTISVESLFKREVLARDRASDYLRRRIRISIDEERATLHSRTWLNRVCSHLRLSRKVVALAALLGVIAAVVYFLIQQWPTVVRFLSS